MSRALFRGLMWMNILIASTAPSPVAGVVPVAGLQQIDVIEINDAFFPLQMDLSVDGKTLLVAEGRSTSGAPTPDNVALLSVIDLPSSTVGAAIELGTGHATDVKIKPNSDEAWVLVAKAILSVSNGTKRIEIVNYRTGQRVRTIELGFNAGDGAFGPHRIAFLSNGSKAYVTDGGSTNVFVLDTQTYQILKLIDLRKTLPVPVVSIVGIDITPDDKRILIGSRRDAALVEIDALTDTPKSTIRNQLTGSNVTASVAIHPDGTRAYLSTYHDDEIAIFDLTQGSPRWSRNISTGGAKDIFDMTITDDGCFLLLACGGPTGYMWIVDIRDGSPTENKPVGAVAVGASPFDVVFQGSPAAFAYVANGSSDSVSVIGRPNILGRVFEDLNGDGLRDPGEPGLQNWSVRRIATAPSPRWTVTDQNGFYGFVASAGTHTLGAEMKAGWTQTFPVNPDSHEFEITGDPEQPAEIGDFGFQFTGAPAPDLWVETSYGDIRPPIVGAQAPLCQGVGSLDRCDAGAPECCGSDRCVPKRYRVEFGNNGEPSVTDCEVILNLPEGVEFLSAELGAMEQGGPVTGTNPILPDAQSGNISTGFTLFFNRSLPADACAAGTPGSLAHRFLDVFVELPCCLCCDREAGERDLVAIASIFSPTVPDQCDPKNLCNNQSFHREPWICSRDPNSKEVEPLGCGPERLIERDEPLNYRINFQNLGAGPASWIRITDELDEALLDIGTVRFLESSHPAIFEVLDTGTLRWTFFDIDLPPASRDPAGSNGFVIFSVRPRPDVSAGAAIENRASIFFDFNPPVITNVTANTIRGADPGILCPPDVVLTADETCCVSWDPSARSCDPDATVTAEPALPARLCGVGEHFVTYTATGETGNTSSCTTKVTLVDETPPEISVAVEPDELWPPDHRMVDVVASVAVTDACTASSAAILTAVSSSEPDNARGNGDGDTVDDIQGAEVGVGDFELRLRAERAGAGPGRTYTVLYKATDAFGNEGSASATVSVPHDRRQK